MDKKIKELTEKYLPKKQILKILKKLHKVILVKSLTISLNHRFEKSISLSITNNFL